MKAKKIDDAALRDYGRGWTWRINNGLCHWAEPARDRLLRGGKPSPEAEPVFVALVPFETWRRVRRALGAKERKR